MTWNRRTTDSAAAGPKNLALGLQKLLGLTSGRILLATASLAFLPS